jgi:hypothetical protein
MATEGLKNSINRDPYSGFSIEGVIGTALICCIENWRIP